MNKEEERNTILKKRIPPSILSYSKKKFKKGLNYKSNLKKNFFQKN